MAHPVYCMSNVPLVAALFKICGNDRLNNIDYNIVFGEINCRARQSETAAGIVIDSI